jgi:hypothetical protein
VGDTALARKKKISKNESVRGSVVLDNLLLVEGIVFTMVGEIVGIDRGLAGLALVGLRTRHDGTAFALVLTRQSSEGGRGQSAGSRVLLSLGTKRSGMLGLRRLGLATRQTGFSLEL